MTQDGSRFRWRLIAACVVLTGLAMTQSPGLLVADTKLDLAIAPLDFLARAAHLWDAEGAFGQLQNQAYGYLWPMGPFFALGDLLDLPGWVVQRLWLALVMCVAFVGSAVVAARSGCGRTSPASSPGSPSRSRRGCSPSLGPISVEAWPSALAPWVLLPLVIGAERGSPRRLRPCPRSPSPWSAASTRRPRGRAAAGALWLLTRTAGRAAGSMMLWWPVFTLLGTLWWFVPLFLLGSYSPPFLDFIESAASHDLPHDVVRRAPGDVELGALHRRRRPRPAST